MRKGKTERKRKSPLPKSGEELVSRVAWPEDESVPLEYSTLHSSIKTALQALYSMKRKPIKAGGFWEGPPFGSEEDAIEGKPNDMLSAFALFQSNLNLDQTPLDVVIRIALLLGIEQGRRLVRAQIKRNVKVISETQKRMNTRRANASAS